MVVERRTKRRSMPYGSASTGALARVRLVSVVCTVEICGSVNITGFVSMLL